MNEIFLQRLDEIFLLEEVFGKLAFVYHRTGRNMSKKDVEENLINSIITGGLRPTENPAGMAWGVGVYTTFDLKSQLKDDMKFYGDYLIKSKVNLGIILCFNYEISKKVHGKDYTIKNQLINVFKVYNERNFPSKFEKVSELLEKAVNGKFRLPVKDDKEYTSDFVDNFIKTPEVINKIGGVLFHGRSDGNTVVFYDNRHVYPFQYAYVPVHENNSNIKWINKGNIKKLRSTSEETLNGLKNLGSPYIAYIIRKKQSSDEKDWNKVDDEFKNDFNFVMKWVSNNYDTKEREPQLIVLNKYPGLIKSLVHPHRDAQLFVMKLDPYNIGFIKNPHPDVFKMLNDPEQQMKWVKREPRFITDIPNPSEEVQSFIIKNHPKYKFQLKKK